MSKCTPCIAFFCTLKYNYIKIADNDFLAQDFIRKAKLFFLTTTAKYYVLTLKEKKRYIFEWITFAVLA